MRYANIEWRNGQPYSPEYKDIYYSVAGGCDESEHVFLKNNNLSERWVDTRQFTIAETGFGTGLNFILTVKAWLENSRQGAKLHYIGIEKHPVSPDDIKRLSNLFPELVEYFNELLRIYPLPVNGVHPLCLFDGRVHLYLHFFDVEAALHAQRFQVDAWYLDGFSPDRNPELWSPRVFQLIAQNSKSGSTLSTYTCAGSVRRGLESSGFKVKKVKGHGNKREMIIACLKVKPSYKSPSPWYDIPEYKITSKEITIIGAGLAGLSVAWSFAQRNWKVTIIDKYEKVAQEASGNPVGLLLPRLSLDNNPESVFYSSAYLHAVNAFNILQKNTEEKFWFNDGVVSINKKGKTAALIDKYDYPEKFIRLLNNGEIPEYLNKNFDEVSFYEKSGWASPANICEALFEVCSKQAEFITADIGKIKRVGSKWELRNKSNAVVATSSLVVVASGVGITAINELEWLPVSSVRGQMTELAATEQSKHINHALSFEAFVTPVRDGVHYLGASYSLSQTTDELLEEDQQENFSRLESMLPGVFDYPSTLNGRVGFRSVSRDRMPVVGAVPDVDAFRCNYNDLHYGRSSKNYEAGQYLSGLYVTAAHGSRGLCSCLLSAEILVAMIEGSPLPVGKDVVDALTPSRFLIRNFKRNLYRDQ